MNYQGMLIHRKRLERGWSQEGLCKGICAVSYLSKIEQGKATPSEDVLELLFERLGVHVDHQVSTRASLLSEEAYELLFSGEFAALYKRIPEWKEEKHLATEAGLDLLLLTQVLESGEALVDEALEACMSSRQLAMQRIYQNRLDEAIHLMPSAYTYYWAGMDAYEKGHNPSVAIEYLLMAYELASREGAPRLMLNAKLYIGNCYSECRDIENMKAHYKVAERLAKALHDEQALESIAYNIAATQLETGDYAAAYEYFSTLSNANVMSLHKLAICCEKLGKVFEARDALDKAKGTECEYPSNNLAEKMCELVRFRLDNPDYLVKENYGDMLLDCFEECREQLPIGYASFHLPWVLEWYTANRLYKKAYELLMDFPVKADLKVL